MLPVPPETEESTTVVGELLQLSAEIGAEGVVLSVGALVSYVTVRAIAAVILKSGLPYSVLSFESDPILLITSTLIGIFTVQGAASLLLYHFYRGITSESATSVALGFIGLGIGGALLEITVPEAWNLLIGLI